jgi:competence protein ComEA
MLRRLTLSLLASLVWIPVALAGVNVNTASQSELKTLPGIGPSKAAAIVDYRNANGPFASCAALDAVPGIGPATLANITPVCEVGDGTTAPAGETASPPPAASTGGGNRININTAAASELKTLSGIGPSKAAAIVSDREANGPFGSCSDLQRVTGVGPATVAAIANSCTTE